MIGANDSRRTELPEKARLALAISACIATLVACTPQAEPVSKSAADPIDTPLAAAVTSPGVTGEVPADLLDAIVADLVQRETLLREDIEVERAESAVWPDGALGCPRPGEMYTHALVPGYWVVLRVGHKQFDYRASDTGHYRLCGNPFKRQLPVG